MATRSGDIVDLIGGMTIAGHTPCQIYSQDKSILEEANKYLIRIARETITEAEQVARILDNDSPSSRVVAALNSLRKKTGEFGVVQLDKPVRHTSGNSGCINLFPGSRSI
jgi:hypothetical protein